MVRWSEPAILDLQSIHDFIAHDSRYYAKKVIQDIRDKADILDELQGIYMLAVIHKRRDLNSRDIKRLKITQNEQP